MKAAKKTPTNRNPKKESGKISDSARRSLAVVTGASSGIGYEMAKQFAAQGYDLLIADEESGIQRAAHQLARIGISVEAHQINLSARTGVDRLYKYIQADGRAVSVAAINNGVGVGSEYSRGDSLNIELHLVHLNLVCTVHLSRLLLEMMLARGEGRLLLTSSLVLTDPGPFRAVYSATRAFLHAYTLALREELQGSRVTVCSLIPGDNGYGFFPHSGAVARQGYEALMKGKDKVVEGTILGRLLSMVSFALPGSVTSLLQKMQTQSSAAFNY